jgi:hypothetical protein
MENTIDLEHSQQMSYFLLLVKVAKQNNKMPTPSDYVA